MAPLRASGGAVVFTWIYCILWWFIQDACKVLTYYAIDKYLDPPPAPGTVASFRGMREGGAEKETSPLSSQDSVEGWVPPPSTPMRKAGNALGRMLGIKVAGVPAASSTALVMPGGNRDRSGSRATTTVVNPVRVKPSAKAAAAAAASPAGGATAQRLPSSHH